uniref:Uncharacterized protein n=1 Tax=Salix viminalis TaxID=40686 RepID=A0A6N2L8V0_SALVM
MCFSWNVFNFTSPADSSTALEFCFFVEEDALITLMIAGDYAIQGFICRCAQEEVLNHPSVGAFLLLWGNGMEIDSDVRRDNVEKLVKEFMEGERGKKMKSGKN